jgi:hypothetical protein
MNNILKLLDNVGQKFSVSKLTTGSSIDLRNKYSIIPVASGGLEFGYKPFSSNNDGDSVSYLARNVVITNGSTSLLEWETGIGNIIVDNNNLYVESEFVISSSNSETSAPSIPENIPESGIYMGTRFSPAGTKTLYILPNEINYSKAFNNLVSISSGTSSFNATEYKTTYIVDLGGQSDITCNLPLSTTNNAGLILDFKTINDNQNSNLNIYSSGTDLIDDNDSLTISTNNYKAVISTGSGWTTINPSPISYTGVPIGDQYSLQYKDGDNFGGSSLITNDDGDLIIGNATVLRSSGNNEFNLNKNNQNFIVHGVQGKNLLFTGDGKLGLNMPSGAVPQTPLHILQNSCVESIRVENRHISNPSVLTLYHRPSTIPSSGAIPAKINLASKNSSSNQINYATIKSKVLESTAGSCKGAFEASIHHNGSEINILELSKNYIRVGSDNNISGNNSVIGKNNSIVSGINNLLIGDNITYSGNNALLIGQNSNTIELNDSGIYINSSGYPIINISSGLMGIGKYPTTELDVNGSIKADNIIVESISFNDSYNNGNIPLMSGDSLYVSDYNINQLFIGNTSGLVVRTGGSQGSGLSNIYIQNNQLNINTAVILDNDISQSNPLFLDSNNTIAAYSGINFATDNVVINKKVQLNTTDTYSVNGNQVDLYSKGYIASSGLVVSAGSYAVTNSVLFNKGNGEAYWKELNAADLAFNGLDVSWNKYNSREASINGLQIILINADDTPEEFVVGDVIAVLDGNDTYYRTIDSKTTVDNKTALILTASLDNTITSGFVYSVTRGGYLQTQLDANSQDPNSTTNRFSIRPNTSTLFNSGKQNIDYGIYGNATNYALYINANYNNNTYDESQVVINGNIPYNISGTRYATLSVSGYLYTTDLKVSDNVYMDLGTVTFSGVA